MASGAAAFLLPVIDAQAAHAIDILGDGHRCHHAILVTDDMAAIRHIDKSQRTQQSSHANNNGHGGPRGPPLQRRPRRQRAPTWQRQQQQIAGGNRSQQPRRSEQRQQQHATQQRRQCSAHGIDRQRRAETPACGARLDAQMTKQCAHDATGQSEHRQRERRFLRDRGTEAVAQASGQGGSQHRAQRGAVRQQQHAGQHRSRQAVQQALAQRQRIGRCGQLALIKGGAASRAEQVHAQQYGEGINGVFSHLAQHPHHDDFMADAQ